jgi:hypothetical protein
VSAFEGIEGCVAGWWEGYTGMSGPRMWSMSVPIRPPLDAETDRIDHVGLCRRVFAAFSERLPKGSYRVLASTTTLVLEGAERVEVKDILRAIEMARATLA